MSQFDMLDTRQQQIAKRAAALTAAARNHDLHGVFTALFAPLGEMEAVRVLLVEQQSYTLVIDALLEAVAHPQPRVRFLAAQAMDHFADQRCAAPLQQLLRDPVPRVRWAALHSLQCQACKLTPLVSEEDTITTLIDLAIHDPSIKVRRVATYELGNQSTDSRVLAALHYLATHEADATIIRNAQRGLAQP